MNGPPKELFVQNMHQADFSRFSLKLRFHTLPAFMLCASFLIDTRRKSTSSDDTVSVKVILSVYVLVFTLAVQPQIENIHFPLTCSAFYPSSLFLCELPSLGDISSGDACNLLTLMELSYSSLRSCDMVFVGSLVERQ